MSVVVLVFGRRQRRDARQTELAGVQKAPRHEVAGSWAPGSAASARQGQHDQLMYCRRATHDQETARIIWQAGTLMRRVTSTPPITQ
jgi:hypothetical protein